MLEVHIRTLDNGYEISDGEIQEVIEIKDEDEKEAMGRLLHRIAESLGIMYDGFSGENLNIQWNKKGDEVE